MLRMMTPAMICRPDDSSRGRPRCRSAEPRQAAADRGEQRSTVVVAVEEHADRGDRDDREEAPHDGQAHVRGAPPDHRSPALGVEVHASPDHEELGRDVPHRCDEEHRREEGSPRVTLPPATGAQSRQDEPPEASEREERDDEVVEGVARDHQERLDRRREAHPWPRRREVQESGVVDREGHPVRRGIEPGEHRHREEDDQRVLHLPISDRPNDERRHRGHRQHEEAEREHEWPLVDPEERRFGAGHAVNEDRTVRVWVHAGRVALGPGARRREDHDCEHHDDDTDGYRAAR